MYNDPNQPPQQPPQNPYELPPTQYAGPLQQPPQNPYEVPPTQYAGPSYNPQQYGPPPYNPSPYAPPPLPGYTQVPQPPKRSLRWLWITLSIIGGVLVLSCAGCVIASAMGYNFLKTAVVGPTEVANSYYQAIENQDYSQAYSYLADNMQTTSGQTLSQNLYTVAAQAKDTTDGQVTNFTQSGFTNSNGTASLTMTVTRNGHAYDVHLKLQQNSSGTWKITSYDDI
ncbi:MAG: DUF3824 domain-containing protein [Ktedonobacteraceae bacterium]